METRLRLTPRDRLILRIAANALPAKGFVALERGLRTMNALRLYDIKPPHDGQDVRNGGEAEEFILDDDCRGPLVETLRQQIAEGKHTYANSLAVIACMNALGISLEDEIAREEANRRRTEQWPDNVAKKG